MLCLWTCWLVRCCVYRLISLCWWYQFIDGRIGCTLDWYGRTIHYWMIGLLPFNTNQGSIGFSVSVHGRARMAPEAPLPLPQYMEAHLDHPGCTGMRIDDSRNTNTGTTQMTISRRKPSNFGLIILRHAQTGKLYRHVPQKMYDFIDDSKMNSWYLLIPLDDGRTSPEEVFFLRHISHSAAEVVKCCPQMLHPGNWSLLKTITFEHTTFHRNNKMGLPFR